MSETRDHVSVHIDNILLGLPSFPCNPTIFRVDDDLRYKSEKFYDPKVVSIGPFLHGKDDLKKMEQHKFRYLKLLLKRRKEWSVDKYVIAIRSLEEKARKCYSDNIESITSDEFVQMLLLDGFFIIELLRKYGFDEMRERDDIIFQYEQILSKLKHDLILVENQVPFFVLDQLFSLTKAGNPDDDIVYLIQLFTDDISPWPEAPEVSGKVFKKVDHFLGLVRSIWCSSFAKMTLTSMSVKIEEEKMVTINSTEELHEAGVKFQKQTESNSNLDIKFAKGVLKVPIFNVSDETESVFRNLIAYEHFLIDNHPKYVTDYVYFLHCLINSSKDLEILRRYGILTNLLGDDEMVYIMFNRLGRNILVSADFCYADVFEKMKGHCGLKKNRWMANLRRNYFNGPWAVISFLAALMLLLFTLTQTVFSVLSYVKPKKT